MNLEVFLFLFCRFVIIIFLISHIARTFYDTLTVAFYVVIVLNSLVLVSLVFQSFYRTFMSVFLSRKVSTSVRPR